MKVLGNNLLVAEKVLSNNLLVAEKVLGNKILCASLSLVTILGKQKQSSSSNTLADIGGARDVCPPSGEKC